MTNQGSASLRYGLIGCGMMGQEHVRNLQLLPEAELTEAFDPDSGMRAALTSLQPQARFHSSFEELLTESDVDAWIIASPNFLHSEQLLQIQRIQPKPTLIEKPICTSLDQVQTLKKMSNEISFPVWVAMEYRYMPPLAALLREVRQPTCLGNLKTVSIREHRFPFLEKVGHWNRFNQNTGGTLVEKCCHFFDLMRLIVQSEPVRVYASGGMEVNHLEERYDGRQPDILDQAFVLVDFANGRRATLDLCMFAEGSEFQEELALVGDAGKVECRIPGPDRFWPEHLGQPPTPELIFSPRDPKGVRKEAVPVDPILLAAGDHHGSTYYQHLKFQEVVRGRVKVEVSLEDGIRAVLIGLAAQESIATGQAVHLQGTPFDWQALPLSE